jgi:acetylornithine deacetylase/succinyl-diaminopimelate desuccinylase-like protein
MQHRTWIAVGMLCTLGWAVAQAQLPAPTIRRLAEARVPDALAMFRDYLALPNDAHSPDDIARLTTWLEQAFVARGFTTRRLETAGLPLLYAERAVTGARRTVLIYLQADGQPVDATRWDQPNPYAAVLKRPVEGGGWAVIPWDRLRESRDPEWRIFARSASDSKGPNIQFLSALDAMAVAGVDLDYTLKVIVDTEEELGSPHMPEALARHRDLLAADMLVIFDGPPHVSNQPSLVFGARGIATITLTTYGPDVPQHSGHYGNFIPNPALRLSQILASMKDERGRVTIPGFYDGVVIDAAARKILADVPDDEAAILRTMGVAEADAVAATLQEAIQYPSLNIRGLASAWVGDQSRTIIPATATAEVDVRLVKESDPQHLFQLIRRHIEGLGYHILDGPPTAEERLRHPRLVTFAGDVSYGAFRTDFEAEAGRWLTAGMTHLFGREPIRIRTHGGSIPIAPFVSTLGVPAVIVPTVNPDNNQHSPNENIRLGNFAEGIAIVLAVLTHPMAP